MRVTRKSGLQLLAGLVMGVMLAGPVAAGDLQAQMKTDSAQGWVHLFDGETLFGWNKLGDADFKAEGGEIVCEKGTGGLLVNSSVFADFELTLQMKVLPGATASLLFRGSTEGHSSENGSGVIVISEPNDAEGKWRTIEVTCDGKTINAKIDGMAVEGLVVSRAKGVIAIQYHGIHFHNKRLQGRVQVKDVKLKPLNLKPIFNGKDLSEWNIIPGRKSEFTVVDGAINIKNGNGQIESKGLYKDFTLQLDIFSNGRQLNSGVFYRGPVGVFWKGYESQVRNHWEGDDRTKPVDYGTGGNYGNQASRKVVSTDGEWFRKTVVCDSNHASVWIDGYQTSDFTDVRQVSGDNDGKGGYVPGPGTIHLQGHDPTTDLSFMNIQIQVHP